MFRPVNPNSLNPLQPKALMWLAILSMCPLLLQAQTEERSPGSSSRFFQTDFASIRTFQFSGSPVATLVAPDRRLGLPALSAFKIAPPLFSSFLKPDGAPPPAATNTTWTGGAGNFSDAAMWSAGVPNGNFNAFIDGGKPVASAVTLDINAALSNLSISSGDSLNISNSLSLTVNGTTLANNGQLLMNSVGNGTDLIVGGANLTLSGTGTLTLSNNTQNFIFGSLGTDTLTNQSTIQGAGSIGNNQLTLVNSGTIDANVSNQLIINPSGGTTNTGTLEATAGGTLNLQNAITNTGAVIKATGAGSIVSMNGTSITGGSLSTQNGGLIQSFGATLTGLTNAGTLQVLNSNSLTLVGTINNTGSIQLNSVGNGTLLNATGTVTLAGGGTVVLSDNSQNYLSGTAGSQFINQDNTISGSGNIGNSTVAFTNHGTVDATSANNNQLLIQTGTAGATNTGTLEASSGGTLQIQNAVNNVGGTIQALAGTGTSAGGNVTLNGSSITGGAVQGLGSGLNTGVVVSTGATLTNLTTAGTIQTPNSYSLTLVGTINNTGSIQLISAGNGTDLIAAGTVTLTGGGTVALSNNTQNYLEGAAGSKLVNVNNTITGAGQIGDSTMAFTNEGTVDAIYSNHLIINTGAAAGVNTGIMEASSGGVLEIDSHVTNESSTTTGTIEALNGGTVSLKGATISGGNLMSVGTGAIAAAGTTLNGSTYAVDFSGRLQTPNAQNLVLEGTVNDNGTISLNSAGNGTDLKIEGSTVTLQGTGKVVLSDNTQNYIKGASTGTEKLINMVAISGAGNVGDDFLTLDNQATIEATSTLGNHLIIDPGTGGATNTGMLAALGGATLELENSINNAGGTISANSGSTVQMDANLALTGGTLSGAGVFVSEGALLSNLTSTSTIAVPNSSSLTLAGTITNGGSIQLNSAGNGTFLNASGTTTLTGGGTVVLSDNSQNYLSGSSGSSFVNQNNTISGSGNVGNNTVAFTNQGTVDATSANGNHLIIQAGGGGRCKHLRTGSEQRRHAGASEHHQ